MSSLVVAISLIARPGRCTSVSLVTLLLIAGPLQGCTAWHSRPPTPPSLLGNKAPQGEVRVTLVNGAQSSLYRPYFHADSLIGFRNAFSWDFATGERVAVPVDSIRNVSILSVDGPRTTVLVLGSVAVLILSIRALFRSGSSEPTMTWSGTDYPQWSCPLLYSWDGNAWQLDSGTFGGAILKTLARTDVDNLERATAENGTLRLRLANEQNETDYVDMVRVLAVDHEPGVTVAPDAEGRLHTLSRPRGPLSARDFRGRDALARVDSRDGWCWESVPTLRDPAVAAEVRDGLELAFARPRNATRGRLAVDGNTTEWAAHLMGAFLGAHGRETAAWYDSMERDPDRARALGQRLAREAFLEVQVCAGAGWERRGLIWDAGPEVMKRQVLALDLSGCEGDTVRIRLESAPCLWRIDQVALDCMPERAMAVTDLGAVRAVDQDGVDVQPLLSGIDGRVYEMETGMHAELRFDVPPVPPGQFRSYVARTHGWYRVHTDETGEPDRALLSGVTARPLGVSRSAVELTNHALQTLEERAR
jgi:hypothetical protein